MSKRIAVVGGGPGGLFFATLMKKRRPEWEITLFERNQADDAFGFGVVFSDATLRRIEAADPVLTDALAAHGKHWEVIDVVAKGETHSFGGNGMAAIHRRTLLRELQAKAAAAGVDMRFGEFVPTPDRLGDYDVIVAGDGANSAFRTAVGDDVLGHTVEQAAAKFIWFGTDRMFDGLTFLHRRNEHGNFAVHAYPISADVSTFIVETDEDTWRAAGLDEFDATQPPGPSDEKTRAYITALFAEELRGGRLLTNNSRWGSFRTRRTERWHAGNIVFLGDAVHTAHFSVGSGTKMAMEDAIALADGLAAHPDDLEAAFAEYERVAQPQVARVQNAARPSLRWWEHFGEYYRALEPWQFAFHFFSRSIPLQKIRLRDQRFAEAVEAEWTARNGAEVLDTPIELGSQRLPGRLLSWGAEDELVHASGEHLDATRARVVDLDVEERAAETADAELVILTGGDEDERIFESERLSLSGDLPVIIELVDGTADQAATLVLSGRADAVVSR
ncbi:FAD-dependent monooxygenase [Leucobacter sp. CSA1]|uniref:FAD-dependent monooxygenase n=1 Tax=Leucobacter chromiisoli TaxID=2796471 RepID=A0A934UVV3_9MICO|nr:FAD-dependent monooxygenase [Leucobacter chromiisoli]MBK0420305.1 FAD-dependent monooxygenase [Leucobacter chromiisoli]